MLVGTMSKGSIVNMEHSNIEIFGIRFYPGGLQSFIKESSDKFTDKMEFIDTLSQDIFTEFEEELRRFGRSCFQSRQQGFAFWSEFGENVDAHCGSESF
jgi:hypothetical protein